MHLSTSNPPKGKTPPISPGEVFDNKQSKREFSLKSPEEEAQIKRIEQQLLLKNCTSYELRQPPAGSYQNPSRIHEMRRRGYDIRTHRVNLVDAAGFLHPRCALYELVALPDGTRVRVSSKGGAK